jgi:hypothetical protein
VRFTRPNREPERATTTETAYRNHYSVEWTATDRCVALVDLSRSSARPETATRGIHRHGLDGVILNPLTVSPVLGGRRFNRMLFSWWW